jgi:hypothetical protein
MARTTKTNSEPQAAKAPDFLAWHVLQKGDKAFWSKVGACWHHKDHKGMTLQLDVVPINGRIVLRQPLDTPPTNAEGSA